MAEINNPHDSFFKRLFGNLATAADFMRSYLPSAVVSVVDLDTLALEKESFIDPKLRSHFSDLLFRVRLAAGGDLYVYLLLEHKSTPDVWVAFQLLRYIVRFWERLYDQGRAKLPAVIPIVFYHGEDRWNVSRQFSALIEGGRIAELQKYVLDFEYDLRDLSASGGEEIKGHARLRTGLELLRHVYDEDLGQRLPDIFRHLRGMNRADALEYLETLLAYLSKAGKKVKSEEIVEAMEQVIPREEFGDVAPFAKAWIAEWEKQGLEKGMEKGLEKGMELGEHKGMTSLTLRLVHRRFGEIGEATRERIRGLPNHRLEDLGEALLDFASSEELRQWLADKPDEFNIV